MGYGFGPPPGYGSKKGKSKKESKPTQETPKKSTKRKKPLFRLLTIQEMIKKDPLKIKKIIGNQEHFTSGYDNPGNIYPGYKYGHKKEYWYGQHGYVNSDNSDPSYTASDYDPNFNYQKYHHHGHHSGHYKSGKWYPDKWHKYYPYNYYKK